MIQIFLKRFLPTNTHERLQDTEKIDKIIRFTNEMGIIIPIHNDDRLATRCAQQGSIFYNTNFVKIFKTINLEAWNLTDETKHGRFSEQQRCFKDPSLCGDC